MIGIFSYAFEQLMPKVWVRRINSSTISKRAMKDIPSQRERAPPREFIRLKGDGNSAISSTFFTCKSR